ncbi:ABC transporter permease [Fundicoccus culcitae]|uniref:ABC transporter permease n=1 Tax=Fundicoccus culcitae TaxID=2969821 RepID=A0ABY5P821_9LACT|nr:hypothetical protein [Fundicoccus culcitae]UUX34735.1 hypothetical protein NRE15_03540 [Fundicoccus culcitae]
MKQLWFYLKTQMRLNIQQTITIFATFIVLPLMFSYFIGFSFSPAFIPEYTSEPIAIYVNNRDEGEQGYLLEEVLGSKEMVAYIELVEAAEDSSFNVTLLEGYSQNMEETLIEIEPKENSSSLEESILVQLLTEIQSSIVNQEALGQVIGALDDPSALLAELDTSFGERQLFNTVAYDETHALTGMQFSSVSGLLFIFVMMLGSSVGMKTKAEFKGLRKRLTILPLTPAQDVLFSMISDLITYSLVGLLYVIIWRLIDPATFSGNLLYYYGWIIIYTLVFLTLNNIMFYFLPSKYTELFYQGFTVIYLLLGLIPIEQFLGDSFRSFFEVNHFRQIFQQPMYDFILTQEWGQHIGLALGLLAFVIIMTWLIIAYRTRKELSPR